MTLMGDDSDLGQLGRNNTGDYAESCGRRVRSVGRARGIKGLGAAYLFASLQTAKQLCQGLPHDQVSFLLARCDNSPEAARRLRQQYDMAVYTRQEFSTSTRLY